MFFKSSLSLWYKSIGEQDFCFQNICEAEKPGGEMTKKNGEFLPHHTTMILFLGLYSSYLHKVK